MHFYQFRKHSYLCSISNNLTYPAHLHKEIEIVHVLSGNIQVTINDISKNLSTGQFSIAFPNTVHSLKTTDTSRILLTIFDIHLTDNDSKNVMYFRPISPFIAASDLHQDILYSLHALMAMEQTKQNALLIRAHLTIILCRLVEDLNLVEVDHNDLNLLQQLLVYIDQHYTEALTLSILAKQLNISRFYLSRIFNQKLGTTFNSYLNQIRIKLAQTLLANLQSSITEISFQSGFESTRTFYRAFKEVCGMTPKEYRRKKEKRNYFYF